MPTADKIALADWQATLDYLLPRKATLRADEIARAAGVSTRTVDRAFDGPGVDATGKVVRPWLLGFTFNAANGERFTRRIPRDCAILWRAQCANHTAIDKVNMLSEAADALCARDLLILQQRIGAMLKKKL